MGGGKQAYAVAAKVLGSGHWAALRAETLTKVADPNLRIGF